VRLVIQIDREARDIGELRSSEAERAQGNQALLDRLYVTAPPESSHQEPVVVQINSPGGLAKKQKPGMKRAFFGAKAGAARKKREALEPIEALRVSDTAPSVALEDGPNRRVIRDWRVADNAKQGKEICEHCRWKPPAPSLLHAHHVVPVSCGGPDETANLLVLCPNCHAIAHYVAPRVNTLRQYCGPRTATELQRWMSVADKPNELARLRRVRMLSRVRPILEAMRASDGVVDHDHLDVAGRRVETTN